MRTLLGYLVKGLLVVLPIAIVVYFALIFFNVFASIFSPIVVQILPNISLMSQRIVSFALMLLFLVLIGYLAECLHPLLYLKKLFLKLPLIKTLFGIQKGKLPSIFEGKRAVLVQFNGVSLFGLLMGEVLINNENTPSSKKLVVFIPNSPLPFTGFIFLFDPEQVRPLQRFSLPQLFTFVSSFGTRNLNQISFPSK